MRGAQDWGRKGGASRSPGGQAFRDLTNEEAPWRMTQQLTAQLYCFPEAGKLTVLEQMPHGFSKMIMFTL